jgi:hypothetical protein
MKMAIFTDGIRTYARIATFQSIWEPAASSSFPKVVAYEEARKI